VKNVPFLSIFNEPPFENFVFVLILSKESPVDGQYTWIRRRVSSDDTLTVDQGKGGDL